MKIKEYELFRNEKYKSKIIQYINDLPLSPDFKTTILEERIFNEITPIYLKSTHLFSSAFGVDNHEKADLLNVAGFLYYRSILFMDQALDSKFSKANSAILISICQEESIKILTSIFGLKSHFWKMWNQRRLEYMKAHQIDHESHDVHSMQDFENLADLKTAFGKVAIDCIYLLSGENETDLYKDLLTSHKLFYCAFQILDDIKDLREDLSNNQFNIALYSLTHELEKRKIDVKKCSESDLSKYLYIFKIADHLYDQAINNTRQNYAYIFIPI